MIQNQTKTSPKRVLYSILSIVFWAVGIGLEILSTHLSNTANAPHAASDVNGLDSLIGGISFIFAAIAIILAIIFTIALIKSNRKN